jgi:hypothetical protein
MAFRWSTTGSRVPQAIEKKRATYGPWLWSGRVGNAQGSGREMGGVPQIHWGCKGGIPQPNPGHKDRAPQVHSGCKDRTSGRMNFGIHERG